MPVNIFHTRIEKRTALTILVWLLLIIYPRGVLFADGEIKKTLKTVVLDAGHGGKDPGAFGKRAKEKDIVLGIVLKLGKYIEEHFDDVRVIYTRDKDVFVPLHERANIANQNGADLFISVHANAWKNSATYGSETYAMGYHTNERNLQVAMKENSVITLEEDYTTHYEGFDPKSAESYIMFNIMQSTYLDQSLAFASHVQDQFRERAMRKDRGVKQAGFLVLWRTTMPSVLIETGYITNEVEERYLMSEQGQDYLASAIFRAFRDYKNEIESKSMFDESKIDPEEQQANIPVTEEKVESEPICFRIQIAASKTKLDTSSEFFSGFDELAEIDAGDFYKYTTQKFTKYQEAMDQCKKIRQQVHGAFVIATRGKKLIGIREAIQQIND